MIILEIECSNIKLVPKVYRFLFDFGSLTKKKKIFPAIIAPPSWPVMAQTVTFRAT